MGKLIILIKQKFKESKPFIVFSLLIFGLVFFIKDVSYLNLVITLQSVSYAYVIFFVVLTKTKTKTLFLIGMGLLIISIILTFLGLDFLVEQIGNIIFLLLAIGIGMIIFSGNTSKHV